MIEFKEDGPCGSDGEGNTKIPFRVVGLGQAGINVLDQMVLYGQRKCDLWAIDTDQHTLDGSIVPEKLLLAESLVHGMGCNGDRELARECLVESSEAIQEVARGCECLALVLSLGGATGSTLAPHFINQAVEQGARVIVLAALPFGFEGKHRQEQTERTLSRLRAHADAVMVFNNDRLLDHDIAQQNLRHGLPILNRLMSECLQAACQILQGQGLIDLSFADMRSLYGRYAGIEVLENCWAGWAETSNHVASEVLVDEVLASPLLPDDVLEHADHAMICLTGGPELSLTAVESIVSEFQSRLPEGFPIATSASLHESSEGRLRVAFLLASTKAPVDPSPAIEWEEEGAEAQEVLSNEVDMLAAVEEEPVFEPSSIQEEVPASFVAPDPSSESEIEPSLCQETFLKEPTSFFAQRVEAFSSETRKQEELPLDIGARGRFENAFETIHKGENLDQPTFRRRKLEIRI